MATSEQHSKEKYLSLIPCPLSNVISNSSAINLRLLESIEFCKYTESTLKILEIKSQSLITAQSEAIKTKGELITRNKTNITNLESLFQAQSELYNYKCAVKTEYINVEEKMKNKRLKYNAMLNSYRKKWEVAEAEYQKSSVSVDVSTLRKENALLYEEYIEWSNLIEKTKINYSNKFKEYQTWFIVKAIDFAKEYRSYSRFLSVNEKIRDRKCTLQTLMSKWSNSEIFNNEYSKDVKFFKHYHSHTAKANSRMQCEAESYFSVDLTAFDKVTVPYHTLEIQTEESITCTKDTAVQNSNSESENCNKYIEVHAEKNNAFQNRKEKLSNQSKIVNGLMSAGRPVEVEKMKICESKSDKAIVGSDKKRKYSTEETKMGNHDEMQHRCNNTNNCNISENTLSNALPMNLAEIEDSEERVKVVDGSTPPFFLSGDNSNSSKTGRSSSIFELF